MRQQELKTVSNAHKATVVAQTSEVMLNTDGTTKNQMKLGAAVVKIWSSPLMSCEMIQQQVLYQISQRSLRI